jgi:uncharacterized protein YfaQ (DUF2300 family)
MLRFSYRQCLLALACAPIYLTFKAAQFAFDRYSQVPLEIAELVKHVAKHAFRIAPLAVVVALSLNVSYTWLHRVRRGLDS